MWRAFNFLGPLLFGALVMSVVVFSSSCFSVSGGLFGGGLSTYNLFLLLMCVLFYFSKYKVQSKKICKWCMHRLEIKTVPSDDYLA